MFRDKIKKKDKSRKKIRIQQSEESRQKIYQENKSHKIGDEIKKNNNQEKYKTHKQSNQKQRDQIRLKNKIK